MFDELEQMQELAAVNLKRECLRFHESTNTQFEEDKFSGFLKEIDLDWHLSSCLVIGYCLHKTSLDLLLAEIEETITMSYHRPLREKMDELDRTYAPYSEILYERFHTISLAGKKILDGDQRGFDEVVKESIPKRYTIEDSKSTRYLEVFRTHPIYHTSVFRTVKYDVKDGKKWIGEKWIYENHYFGVDTKSDEFFYQYQNTMHELARRHFKEDGDILPDRSREEYLWHFHSDLLDPDISWKQLDARCDKAPRVPLVWGPKYINLIYDLLSKVYKSQGNDLRFETPKNFNSIPSSYSEKYWLFVEHPDEGKQILTIHFIAAINKLDRCDAVEGIPRWIKTTLERDVIRELKRERREKKKKELELGKEPDMVSLEYAVPDGEGGEVGEIGANVSGTLLPTIDLPDNDFLFSNPGMRFVAEHITWKSKDIAAELGVSPSRARQMRSEVIATVKESCERIAYLGVYIPGPVDELVRIARLRKRKPYYAYPASFTEGEVPEKEKKLSKLAAKYPKLHKKIKTGKIS